LPAGISGLIREQKNAPQLNAVAVQALVDVRNRD
jgi:hypothetical protein